MSQRQGETFEEWRERDRSEKRARYRDDADFRESRLVQRRAYDKSAAGTASKRRAFLKVQRRLHEDADYRRLDGLKRRGRIYNLAPDEILALGDSCGICGYRPSIGEKALHIDHDHSCCPGQRSCGKCVRGVLCYPCNAAFERFLDSPRVASYLARCRRAG